LVKELRANVSYAKLYAFIKFSKLRAKLIFGLETGLAITGLAHL